MRTKVIYAGDNLKIEECSENGILVWYLVTINECIEKIVNGDELTAFAKCWIEYLESEE